jgi:hypothetical protein
MSSSTFKPPPLLGAVLVASGAGAADVVVTGACGSGSFSWPQPTTENASNADPTKTRR